MHTLCADLGLYAQRWKMLRLKKVLKIVNQILEIILRTVLKKTIRWSLTQLQVIKILIKLRH